MKDAGFNVMPRDRESFLSLEMVAFALGIFCLLVSGASIYILNDLSKKQANSTNSVRENGVWAAFQTDRAVGELERSLNLYIHHIQGTTEKDVGLKLEILLSSRDNLNAANLQEPFTSNAKYTELVDQIIGRVTDLGARYDSATEANPLSVTIANSFLMDVRAIRDITRSMASLTNDIQDSHKAKNRKEYIQRFRILTFQIVGMAILLCAIVALMAWQLQKSRETNELLGRLNTRLIEAKERYKQTAILADAGSRAKTVFLTTMSHEIRTPLNGIIGNVDLLDGPNLNGEQKESLGTIRECGTSLLELIDDVLDFSRLESGTFTLERRRFELGTVIESAVDIVSVKARAKGLGLTALYPSALIDGDEARLRQVLVNLCGNAVKFTEEGDVVICVHRIFDGSVYWLRFEVRDTGIGIPREAQSALFEEFRQLDASINRKHGGSGLGLAISRRLVAAMEGRIGVESELGKGSCFWFTVPIDAEIPVNPVAIRWPSKSIQLATASTMAFDLIQREWGESRIKPLLTGEQHGNHSSDDWFWIDVRQLINSPFVGMQVDRMLVFGYEAGKYQSDARVLVDGPLTTRRLQEALESPQQYRTATSISAGRREYPCLSARVLLVEDNLVNQIVATKLLKRLGLTVEVSEDGEQSVARMKKGEIDLVLMDMQMPVMDGLEATRQIRRLSPELARVPIVGLTANAFTSDRDACIQAGMNDFLSKPVHREKLEAIVIKWCPKSRQPSIITDTFASQPTHHRDGNEAQSPDLQLNRGVDSSEAAMIQISSHTNGRDGINPFVDWNRQQSLSEELGLEVVVELIKLFWRDLDELLVTLERPTAVRDTETTRRVFHTIKGTSETVGFMAISEAASATRDTYLKLGILDMTPLRNARAGTQQYVEQVGSAEVQKSAR